MKLMCSNIADVVSKEVTHQQGSVVARCGMNMLKMAELQLKYGQVTEKSQVVPTLILNNGE